MSQMSSVVIACVLKCPRMKVPPPVCVTGYYRHLLAWQVYYSSLVVSFPYVVVCLGDCWLQTPKMLLCKRGVPDMVEQRLNISPGRPPVPPVLEDRLHRLWSWTCWKYGPAVELRPSDGSICQSNGKESSALTPDEEMWLTLLHH